MSELPVGVPNGGKVVSSLRLSDSLFGEVPPSTPDDSLAEALVMRCIVHSEIFARDVCTRFNGDGSAAPGNDFEAGLLLAYQKIESVKAGYHARQLGLHHSDLDYAHTIVQDRYPDRNALYRAWLGGFSDLLNDALSELVTFA